MDPTLILDAIQTGAAIFKAAGGALSPKAQTAIDTGSAIIAQATKLYGEAKSLLSESDQTKVDDALQAAHDQCGTDLARVLAELDAAAAH